MTLTVIDPVGVPDVSVAVPPEQPGVVVGEFRLFDLIQAFIENTAALSDPFMCMSGVSRLRRGVLH